MEYRYRGITASLTLITVIALIVSFVASAKRYDSEDKIEALHHQVVELTLSNKRLEEKLRWVEGQYAQVRSIGKRLNQALLEEQTRTRTLAERLSVQRRQAAREATRQSELRSVGAPIQQTGHRFPEGSSSDPVGAYGPRGLSDRIPLADAR